VKRVREEGGQAVVFVVIVFIGLLAITALAVDMGSWYTAKRKLQATADAAVLAGAQDLPDTTTAANTARTYANANNTGLNSWSPAFPDTSTISVQLSKQAPAFFAKALGISTVTIHAHASANVGVPGSIRFALPVAVKQSVVCASASTGCFGVAKTLTFDDTSTTSFGSSTWGLLDLSSSSNVSSGCDGKIGESTQATWVTSGYNGLLAVNKYYGATTGQKTSIRNALNTRVGQTLLVPVFDTSNMSWCTAGGFRVIGWAAFVIDTAIPNSDWNPHTKTLHGHFVQYIAEDVDSTPGVPGFGVKVIHLTD
jgi:Flp pilus assembly protein TadG